MSTGPRAPLEERGRKLYGAALPAHQRWLLLKRPAHHLQDLARGWLPETARPTLTDAA